MDLNFRRAMNSRSSRARTWLGALGECGNTLGGCRCSREAKSPSRPELRPRNVSGRARGDRLGVRTRMGLPGQNCAGEANSVNSVAVHGRRQRDTAREEERRA